MKSPGLNRFVVCLGTVFVFMPLPLDLVSQDLVLAQNNVPLVHRLRDNQETYLETLTSITRVRSQNAVNHFGLATLYRVTFEAIDDPLIRRSPGIVAAIEYERGLELNPFQQNIRLYYADMLEYDSWLMDVDAVTKTPEGLYREGVRLAPTHITPYLDFAEWLDRQGRSEEAYRMLVNEALPWANHRYDNYRLVRLELLERVVSQAIKREDRDTLEAVLRLLG